MQSPNDPPEPPEGDHYQCPIHGAVDADHDIEFCVMVHSGAGDE